MSLKQEVEPRVGFNYGTLPRTCSVSVGPMQEDSIYAGPRLAKVSISLSTECAETKSISLEVPPHKHESLASWQYEERKTPTKSAKKTRKCYDSQPCRAERRMSRRTCTWDSVWLVGISVFQKYAFLGGQALWFDLGPLEIG